MVAASNSTKITYRESDNEIAKVIRNPSLHLPQDCPIRQAMIAQGIKLNTANLIRFCMGNTRDVLRTSCRGY